MNREKFIIETDNLINDSKMVLKDEVEELIRGTEKIIQTY